MSTLLISGSMVGCGPSEDRDAPPSDWTQQVEDVADGQSTTITVDQDSTQAGERPLRPSDLLSLSDRCARLERITVLRSLTPDDRSAVDSAWETVLPALPNLRRVTFEGPVSAAGFGAPGGPPLTHLNLPAAAADGADLRALAEGVPSLVLLRLQAPGATDDDLAALRKLPALRFLHLIDAPLTDAAVPHLAACAALESCYLDRSQLTADGWEELHRLRPDLHLHADLTHPVGGH
ncbi:hypothetical protein [Alienimonas chondri]|uniref:Leucine-rich repeat domain-containing protein n=1 Tax=Alienimonas chondri TaxID=2681879 RepID=A0ABX1VBS0_9PLAN|nr:hypothetical protein [Alienimonas chondri]NNJ25557.1 hypothetical protein [Alienimonas chondri]